MEDFLLAWGYPALFLLSFLAATLVPLGSEWLLAVMLAHGYPAPEVVAVATLGNTFGALTTWAIGWWGSDWLIERVLRIDSTTHARAEKQFRRWGSWSLLFAWLPVVGDPLCLVAGLFRFPLLPFLLLVLFGKGMRYLAVAGLVGFI